MLKECSGPFMGPTGGPIEILGKTNVCLCLGTVKLEKEIVVVDLQDECLLGADILLGLVEGPFNFMLSEGRLVWNGVSIPCIQVGCHEPMRVRCAATYTIPAFSESILDANVVRSESESTMYIPGQKIVIEASPRFEERKTLKVASSLAVFHDDPSIKVRVMNPFSNDTVVYKGEVLGNTYEVNEVIPLFNKENPKETNNYNCMKRIALTTASDQLHDFRDESTGSVNQVYDGLEFLQYNDVPLHLQELYDSFNLNKPSIVKLLLAELLTDYGDTFSKSDDDLGYTNITAHEIDTGDARPMKQAPRRTPMAFQGKDKDEIEKMLQRGIIR